LEERTPYGNQQSVVAEQFASEEEEKEADLKLLIAQRRHHLAMAATIAERLGITACPTCGKKRA